MLLNGVVKTVVGDNELEHVFETTREFKVSLVVGENRKEHYFTFYRHNIKEPCWEIIAIDDGHTFDFSVSKEKHCWIGKLRNQAYMFYSLGDAVKYACLGALIRRLKWRIQAQ